MARRLVVADLAGGLTTGFVAGEAMDRGHPSPAGAVMAARAFFAMAREAEVLLVARRALFAVDQRDEAVTTLAEELRVRCRWSHTMAVHAVGLGVAELAEVAVARDVSHARFLSVDLHPPGPGVDGGGTSFGASGGTLRTPAARSARRGSRCSASRRPRRGSVLPCRRDTPSTEHRPAREFHERREDRRPPWARR